MSDLRQAPKLYHSGKKDKKDFYLLPKNLMDSIFNQLSGKQGNQIKLMCVLLGTLGDGSFRVSEKWICDRTGMEQSAYVRARAELIEKGWLSREGGNLYVQIENIKNSEVASEHVSDMASPMENVIDHMAEAYDDSMHNIEKINKKTNKRIDADCAVLPQGEGKNEKAKIPEGIVDMCRDVYIDLKPNSVTILEKIIGEDIDYTVLSNLLREYRHEFSRAYGKSAGYAFAILQNKVRDHYDEQKRKYINSIAEERAYQSEELDLSRIHAPQSQEGLDDISDILDEFM